MNADVIDLYTMKNVITVWEALNEINIIGYREEHF